MPTPELTRLAKEAVAGAEDSMREFLLRADSEYLDQYRTPEMAAEKYVELAEDRAEESGVDPVRETPAAEALDEMNRRRLVQKFDENAQQTVEGLDQFGEGMAEGLEPFDRAKGQVRGAAQRGMNELLVRQEMQPGQPMHSASIAIKEGRHDKAAAVLEQMLRQDDAAVSTSKMSPVARERTEAMLRVARLVEQSKASDKARAAREEQYDTEAEASRLLRERQDLGLKQTIRDANPLFGTYVSTDAMMAVRDMAEAAGLGEKSLLRETFNSSKNLDDLLDLHEAGLLTLSPEIKQHAIDQKRQMSEIEDRSSEAYERLPALREQDRALSEEEQILRKHAALLESKYPYRNQRAGGGMTTEK